jgi:carbon starvation protein
MNAVPLIVGAIAIFVLAYRFYYSWVVAKALTVQDLRETPAYRLGDGQNYVPMSKWVLFGHHFAAIAGAGPLVGPVLATQFGYFPGFLWMALGSVIAGAMHDLVILVASVQHDGKSLAEIARAEISRLSGGIASLAILIILIVALAGMGLVVVNALAESSWGTFTIAMTIPIAVFMGFWMFRFRKGKTGEATLIGVILLSLAVIYGRYIPESAIANWFIFDKPTLTILIAAYGFLASVLPVWVLLSPSRLPQFDHEAGRGGHAGGRHHYRHARGENACFHAVHPRWRAHHSRAAVPVFVYNDCLRRHIRISFDRQFGDHPQDAL